MMYIQSARSLYSPTLPHPPQTEEHPDWSCSVYELNSEQTPFLELEQLPLLDLALVHSDSSSLQHTRVELGPVCFAGG